MVTRRLVALAFKDLQLAIVWPDPPSQLAQAIDESRKMLDLPENWDGEGSPSYTEDTWERAVEIVRLLCGSAVGLPVPLIGPAEAGSVDLYWGEPGKDLLLNVPAQRDEPVTYYGRKGKGTFSGVLDDVAIVADWLKSLQK